MPSQRLFRPDLAKQPEVPMNAPQVTVLLTVYNGLPYLREAVRSILGQTLQDFVFLILNNGSEDGTEAYLSSLSDPRLHVVNLPRNIGRTPVLNKGLMLCRTEFTAVIDADDLAAPTRLEKQCALLREHPDIALVGSDVTYIDGTGNAIGAEHFPATHEELRNRLPLHNQFAHAACTFRTEAAMAVGRYPESFPYAQDFAMWIAMLKAGYKAASIQEPLASVRVHPGQTSKNLSLVLVRGEDNYHLAEAMLDIPGMPKASRQAARMRAAAALVGLGRLGKGFAETGRAIAEDPLRFFINPLLWERLRLDFRRWKASLRASRKPSGE